MELFTTAGKVANLAKIWLAVTEGDVRGRLNRFAHWPDTENLDEGQIVPLEAVLDVRGGIFLYPNTLGIDPSALLKQLIAHILKNNCQLDFAQEAQN